MARLVAVGGPHFTTQRGNRRQKVFFGDEDYHAYVDLLATWCTHNGVALWAYCLMANQVRRIAVPEAVERLNPVISEAHRRYSRHINSREGGGPLWQRRLASFPTDEAYLVAAGR